MAYSIRQFQSLVEPAHQLPRGRRARGSGDDRAPVISLPRHVFRIADERDSRPGVFMFAVGTRYPDSLSGWSPINGSTTTPSPLVCRFVAARLGRTASERHPDHSRCPRSALSKTPPDTTAITSQIAPGPRCRLPGGEDLNRPGIRGGSIPCRKDGVPWSDRRCIPMN
jgi:hypothetical protein